MNEPSAAHIPYSAEEQAGIAAYRLAVENAYGAKSGIARERQVRDHLQK